jgi:polyketide synthase PksN
MAYTSQAGRTPMNARLVVIASSVEDLRSKLNQWIALGKNKDIHPGAGTAELNGVFYGNIREIQYNAGDLIEGPAGKVFLADLLANNDLEKLARLWILGVEIDWSLLRRDTAPRKISLPTYPFAKERHWIKIDQQALVARTVQQNALDNGKVTARERTEEKRRTYYASQWTLHSIAVPKEKPAVGPMLMLDVSDELFLAMNEQLQNASCSDPIVLVKPGKSFQEIQPNIYIIDPEREEHFHELIQNLKSKALLPRVILHHCSEACNLEVKAQVTQHLNNGIYKLFYLSKALMKENHQVSLRFLSVFSSHSEVTAPLGAAIGSFFKTLTLENPRHLAKAVDIQSGIGSNGEISLSEKASLIWEEIYEKDWTAREIRYRNYMDEGKQRQARYISELVSHAPVERDLSALPLRQNGVYLITGGLGGLGLIFAEYLAKNFQSKLVLVGRSVPSVRQEEKLRQLKGYGAEILVVPDLEAGNMLAKNLTFLSGADAAGIVLGARVPIILTSRADNVRTRMASCAVAMLLAHSRGAKEPIRA